MNSQSSERMKTMRPPMRRKGIVFNWTLILRAFVVIDRSSEADLTVSRIESPLVMERNIPQ